MLKLIKKIQAANKFARDDSGATAIEYGLIAGLIAVVLIVAIGLAGDSLDGMFTYIAGELDNARTP